jgi:4-amino-4-deoxy-L-arabinose transferase-like glycosyltransferase
MTRRTTCLIAFVMFAIGAALRVNNALVFSPLRAYDGYAHFSYIWFLAEQWRIPLPTSGWQFFQPPLYYALMAWLWDTLTQIDPLMRLKLGTMAMALLGLVHAWASFAIVGRVVPGNRLAQLAAAGLMLFLPVHLYSAGFIGNEYLCAVFCSVSLLALLRVLDRPTWLGAAWLGLCLGAAMMTKFTGLVVVAGAFATIGARTVLRREWASGIRTMAIAGAVLLVCCGWFYGRNVMVYGTPFKMSRETFVLARYEHIQTTGRRNVWEYVLFDPLILYRPQWPRGVPLVQETPAFYPRSAARESVLTGIYANAWFDGYGGWVLPAVWQSEVVRRSGQALLTLGLVPSILVLVGFGVAIGRLRRRGWDDTLVAMVTTFVAMLAVVVQGTSSVPTHAAVKATYLLPVSAVFGFWFGLGLDWVQRRHPRWLRGIVASCVLLATISGTVFCQGHTVGKEWFGDQQMSPLWRNIYGVVYHAGGDDVRAREYFRSAADEDYHVALENLAILDMNDEPMKALHYMRRALALQPFQSLGTPWDRELFNRNTAAEYLNTMAAIYHRLGWEAQAEEAARRAVLSDRSFPEAAYDAALLTANNALAGPGSKDPQARAAWLARSRRLLFDTLVLDPAFAEARELSATLEAVDGRCDEAGGVLRDLETMRGPRFYPVDTGIGDMLAASIKRRRHITDVPEVLTPGFQIARCQAAQQKPQGAQGEQGEPSGHGS